MNQVKKQKTSQTLMVQALSNQNRKDIIFGTVLLLIGLISAPVFLQIGFNKNFDANLYSQSLLKTLAILGGFLFIIVISTIALRAIEFAPTPEVKTDPPSIIAINQIIQNTIIYTISFVGLYSYISKDIDVQQNFYYNRLPFVFLASIALQFTGRLLQIITSFKGFRYIGHMLTFFVFALMIIQIL